MCYDNTKPSNTERRALYQDALLKYDQWVRFGSKETPKCYFKKNCKYDGNKGEVANTFINQSTGALSDGYYKNGIHIGEDLYENDGFIVHFFSKNKVNNLSKGFEVLNIEKFEEGKFPRKLFIVQNRKI